MVMKNCVCQILFFIVPWIITNGDKKWWKLLRERFLGDQTGCYACKSGKWSSELKEGMNKMNMFAVSRAMQIIIQIIKFTFHILCSIMFGNKSYIYIYYRV